MSQHVLLNSVDHKDIKIITERSAKYGDNVWFSVTFPAEFRSVQAHYPIFFQKEMFQFSRNQKIPILLSLQKHLITAKIKFSIYKIF